MNPVTLKPIKIGYGDDLIVITPKMMSVAQQDELQGKFTDIADTDTGKYEKEFILCREALEEFSAEPAYKLEKVKGEYTQIVIEGGLASYFKERTAENERVVRETYQLMLLQMRPTSVFL